jgi:conjugal transfer pilus assembly protein TraB
MDAMSVQLASVQKQAQQMEKAGGAVEPTGRGAASSGTTAERLVPGADSTADAQLRRQAEEIAKLHQQVDEEKQHANANAPAGTMMAAGAQAQSQTTPGTRTGQESIPRIKTIDADPAPPAVVGQGAKSAEPPAKPKPKPPTAYIPSGSMLAGVLITGVDAPTGRGSNADPIPILVRVKHEAILPNRYRADVRECFIVGSAYGDLSSERAYVRGETLSCVRVDGKVIDTTVKMYLVGEDGKAGIRGHLVSKQGQAIAKAAVAGFAQAYANALQPNVSVYGGGNGAAGNTPLSTQALQGASFGGASSALDRIAKFEIDLANQMFPVVEIDAGRPVTFIVLKGSELPLTAASR